MKEKKKKIISLILTIAIIASCFACGISAYAKSHRLILDVKYSDIINGEEDKVWYIFTPEVSGTYSFLSFNVRHSEAYLFTKEMNADKTQKVFTQVAYSRFSYDYVERGQGSVTQFCLTYHLEAGETYYYAAGWWLESRDDGTMTVMLTCDEYDEEPIDSISVVNTASLEENTGGSWQLDSAGERYFNYDYTAVLPELMITVHYLNGTEATVMGGVDNIDGNSIQYSVDQSSEHWYPQTDKRYTANTIKITILGKSVDVDVKINPAPRATVRLKIVDFVTGTPLTGATAICDEVVYIADDNGMVEIPLSEGEYEAILSYDNAIERSVHIAISTVDKDIDVTENGVGLIVGDYVADGIINGKDYAYLIRHLTGEEKQSEADKFIRQVNFTEREYEEINLRQDETKEQ